ncbi:MAG: signal peptide peptidase SppA [Thermogutta sp.]|nr:signal peptide peptidase SppA [Thermogutta sp.]
MMSSFNPPEGVVTAQVIPQDQGRSYRPSTLGRTLVIVFLGLFLMGSLFVNVLLVAALGLSGFEPSKVREKHFSHNSSASDKVAILSLEGLILDGEGFAKDQIDQVMKDESVKAAVLRVDSPGGTVTGSDYILHHLKKMRSERDIPVVVSMGSIAASGGYYVSMAVGDTPRSIFAEPTTWTGSIGVIIPHYDAAELAAKLGIKEDSVASHRLKGMGSFLRPMTEEERAIFQQLVEDSFSRFKEIVRDGRPRFRQKPEELDKLATGQVFTAQQAKDSGLVDEIGFLEDAVDRAIELAGLDPQEVNVIRYRREPTLADLFLGETMSARLPHAEWDWRVLFDAAVPRPFYLFSRLPVLVDSGR